MKLTHEENRKELFKESKPLIRPLTDNDLWVLWAAYKEGSFNGINQNMNRDEFLTMFTDRLANYGANLLIEDYNPRFKEKRGAVGLACIKSEGSRIEPEFLFFSWSNEQNVLRSTVRFFNWIRYSKQVGICVVECLKENLDLFHKIKEYGVLYYTGKIVSGDPYGRGDQYIFSIKGKKV
jgi:hypothetical protein